MLSNDNPSPTPALEEAVRDSTVVIIQLPLFLGTQANCSLPLLWNFKQKYNKIFVPYLKDPNLGYVID